MVAPVVFAVIAFVIASTFVIVSSIVVMMLFPVVFMVVVLVKVGAGVVIVVILVLVVVGVWVRLRRFRLRVRLRRLRSGRWAGVWIRRHIVPRKQRKPTTAALRAFWGQGQDKARLDVRGAGCEGEDQEKVFHHSLSNLAKTENDLRYDFIRRSICSTFHSLRSVRASSSSR